MLLFCAISESSSPVFSFHFGLWLNCFPEKDTEEIMNLLKVKDDYLNSLEICFPLWVETEEKHAYGKDSSSLKCNSTQEKKSESGTGK